MLQAPHNKMQQAEETKDVTIQAKTGVTNEYHFAGSGKWKPLSVVAASIEEATEIWKTRRVPVEAQSSPESPAKVEENKLGSVAESMGRSGVCSGKCRVN